MMSRTIGDNITTIFCLQHMRKKHHIEIILRDDGTTTCFVTNDTFSSTSVSTLQLQNPSNDVSDLVLGEVITTVSQVSFCYDISHPALTPHCWYCLQHRVDTDWLLHRADIHCLLNRVITQWYSLSTCSMHFCFHSTFFFFLPLPRCSVLWEVMITSLC